MSQEAALQAVGTFRGWLDKLLQTGPGWELESQWYILKNDIDEWVSTTFEDNSKDYRQIDRILHPMTVILGAIGNRHLEISGKAERLLEAFALVENRLKEGQAMLPVTPDEHLIEPGTPHSAYVFLRDIVEPASRLVFAVDPYVDRSLFSLLSNVAASVEIRILTRQQNAPADFVIEASKFVQQIGANLDCRAGLNDFHDRFLVVDNRLFFSGASFKDLGKKASVVAEVQDIKARTLAELETRWNSATQLK